MVERARMSEVMQDHPPLSDADRFLRDDPCRLSGPGLRVFAAIADLWDLTQAQRRIVMGSPAWSTYLGWLEAARVHRDLTLPVDVLMRISAVLGIHQALRVLHQDERDGIAWLRGPHDGRPFGGRAPLDLVVDGTLKGPLAVRQVLDGLASGQGPEPNEIDRDSRPYTMADLVMS